MWHISYFSINWYHLYIQFRSEWNDAQTFFGLTCIFIMNEHVHDIIPTIFLTHQQKSHGPFRGKSNDPSEAYIHTYGWHIYFWQRHNSLHTFSFHFSHHFITCKQLLLSCTNFYTPLSDFCTWCHITYILLF